MKKTRFIDFLLRHGLGFALTFLVIVGLSISLTVFLGVVLAWAWWEQVR